MNSLVLAMIAATIAVLLGAVIGWIDLRTRMPGRKLLDYFSLIPLGLPGIVMAVALIQFWLAMPIALWYAGDPAARLCRPLHSARRARRQCVAAAGRPVARGKRADPRRLVGDDLARDHATADPARPVRRLAAGVRAGDPGAFRVDPVVLVELDHLGGRGLQPL